MDRSRPPSPQPSIPSVEDELRAKIKFLELQLVLSTQDKILLQNQCQQLEKENAALKVSLEKFIQSSSSASSASCSSVSSSSLPLPNASSSQSEGSHSVPSEHAASEVKLSSNGAHAEASSPAAQAAAADDIAPKLVSSAPTHPLNVANPSAGSNGNSVLISNAINKNVSSVSNSNSSGILRSPSNSSIAAVTSSSRRNSLAQPLAPPQVLLASDDSPSSLGPTPSSSVPSVSSTIPSADNNSSNGNGSSSSSSNMNNNSSNINSNSVSKSRVADLRAKFQNLNNNPPPAIVHVHPHDSSAPTPLSSSPILAPSITPSSSLPQRSATMLQQNKFASAANRIVQQVRSASVFVHPSSAPFAASSPIGNIRNSISFSPASSSSPSAFSLSSASSSSSSSSESNSPLKQLQVEQPAAATAAVKSDDKPSEKAAQEKDEGESSSKESPEKPEDGKDKEKDKEEAECVSSASGSPSPSSSSPSMGSFRRKASAFSPGDYLRHNLSSSSNAPASSLLSSSEELQFHTSGTIISLRSVFDQSNSPPHSLSSSSLSSSISNDGPSSSVLSSSPSSSSSPAAASAAASSPAPPSIKKRSVLLIYGNFCHEPTDAIIVPTKNDLSCKKGPVTKLAQEISNNHFLEKECAERMKIRPPSASSPSSLPVLNSGEVVHTPLTCLPPSASLGKVKTRSVLHVHPFSFGAAPPSLLPFNSSANIATNEALLSSFAASWECRVVATLEAAFQAADELEFTCVTLPPFSSSTASFSSKNLSFFGFPSKSSMQGVLDPVHHPTWQQLCRIAIRTSLHFLQSRAKHLERIHFVEENMTNINAAKEELEQEYKLFTAARRSNSFTGNNGSSSSNGSFSLPSISPSPSSSALSAVTPVPSSSASSSSSSESIPPPSPSSAHQKQLSGSIELDTAEADPSTWYTSIDEFGSSIEEPDDPSVIEFEESGDIRCANLPKLVERLTHYESFDNNFLYVFLLCYKNFSSPSEFFDKLMQRFNLQPPPDLSKEELVKFKRERLNKVRLRIAQVVKTWLEKNFNDFKQHPELASKMEMFLCADGVLARNHNAQVARTLFSVYQKKMSDSSSSSNSSTPSYTPAVEDCPKSQIPRGWSSMQESIAKLKADGNVESVSSFILEWPSIEIARQMTLIEFEFFRKIEQKEFLNNAWSKAKRETDAKGITSMIARFNEVSRWCSTEILRCEEIKKRRKVVEKFIEIASECRELNNFNGVFEIVGGLSVAGVLRLKKTWEGVSSSAQKQLTELRALISNNQNYKMMRSLLVSIRPPAVPYTGMMLTDLTFLEEGLPNMLREKINFVKQRKLAQVIKNLLLLQQEPYKLLIAADLRELLLQLTPLEEEELYSLSLVREPRAASLAPQPVAEPEAVEPAAASNES